MGAGGEERESIMKEEKLESIFNNIIYDRTYDEISQETGRYKFKLSVFDAEYRITQSMARASAGFSTDSKEYYGALMERLLAAANGKAAYSIPVEKLLLRLREYEGEKASAGADIVPITLIAHKIDSGCVFCSVELMFYLEHNLYVEHAAEVIKRFEHEKYCPMVVIGRGDFTGPIKKVFSEQFGFICNH